MCFDTVACVSIMSICAIVDRSSRYFWTLVTRCASLLLLRLLAAVSASCTVSNGAVCMAVVTAVAGAVVVASGAAEDPCGAVLDTLCLRTSGDCVACIAVVVAFDAAAIVAGVVDAMGFASATVVIRCVLSLAAAAWFSCANG